MRKIVLSVIVFISCVFGVSAEGPKTVITGDKMTIMDGGKKVVYSGRSKAVRGDRSLTADTIVQDKSGSRLEAKNNVTFRGYSKEGEPVKGTADNCWYMLEDERGELSGKRANLTYQTKTSSAPMSMTADRIAFDMKKEQVNASGNVEVLSFSATAHSPRLVYSESNKMMVLEKLEYRPWIVYKSEDKTVTYRADTIIGTMDNKKLVCSGNAVGVFEFKD
jgi:lipopolysaccharide transport protein LptA